jgi:YD repeat-containing protein
MHILRDFNRGLRRRRSAIASLISFALAICFSDALAQQTRITYLYDDLGRLVRVITETGDAATYHYDAVGNILRITRETGVSATASVVNVSPNSGVRGTSFPVSITGLNLSGANLTSGVAGITFSNIRTTLDPLKSSLKLNSARSRPHLQ